MMNKVFLPLLLFFLINISFSSSTCKNSCFTRKYCKAKTVIIYQVQEKLEPLNGYDMFNIIITKVYKGKSSSEESTLVISKNDTKHQINENKEYFYMSKKSDQENYIFLKNDDTNIFYSSLNEYRKEFLENDPKGFCKKRCKKIKCLVRKCIKKCNKICQESEFYDNPVYRKECKGHCLNKCRLRKIYTKFDKNSTKTKDNGDDTKDTEIDKTVQKSLTYKFNNKVDSSSVEKSDTIIENSNGSFENGSDASMI